MIVPVVKDVDKKSILDLSKELPDLAERTRSRKVKADELKGGTFTISNVGGIGGTYFTPIINAPEVGILAVGRGRQMPVVKNDETVVRWMLPLGLSYDHRVVDGADGARFIKSLVAKIEGFKDKDL